MLGLCKVVFTERVKNFKTSERKVTIIVNVYWSYYITI